MQNDQWKELINLHSTLLSLSDFWTLDFGLHNQSKTCTERSRSIQHSKFTID